MAIFWHRIYICRSMICVSYKRNRETSFFQYLFWGLESNEEKKLNDVGLSDSGTFMLVDKSKGAINSCNYKISELGETISTAYLYCIDNNKSTSYFTTDTILNICHPWLI